MYNCIIWNTWGHKRRSSGYNIIVPDISDFRMLATIYDGCSLTTKVNDVQKFIMYVKLVFSSSNRFGHVRMDISILK